MTSRFIYLSFFVALLALGAVFGFRAASEKPVRHGRRHRSTS